MKGYKDNAFQKEEKHASCGAKRSPALSYCSGPSQKIERSDISGHVEDLFLRSGNKIRDQFWRASSALQLNTRCFKFDRFQMLAACNSKLQRNLTDDEGIQKMMLPKRKENMPHVVRSTLLHFEKQGAPSERSRLRCQI